MGDHPYIIATLILSIGAIIAIVIYLRFGGKHTETIHLPAVPPAQSPVAQTPAPEAKPQPDTVLFRVANDNGYYPQSLYAPYYFPVADRPWYQPWRRWSN